MINTAIKFWIYGKQSATDALKTTEKWEIQKAAGETGDFIGNKIADKIMNISKKNCNRTIRNQLQMNMKIYIQIKDRQLLKI